MCLSPRCSDGGYLIFVTLNKEELDPAHDYPDQLFAQKFVWVTRRDATEDKRDYINLRSEGTRVSLFCRANPLEAFAYLGELEYEHHYPFKDPASGRSQIRFDWHITTRVPDSLLQDLTFGLAPGRKRLESASRSKSPGHSSKKISRDWRTRFEARRLPSPSRCIRSHLTHVAASDRRSSWACSDLEVSAPVSEINWVGVFPTTVEIFH